MTNNERFPFNNIHPTALIAEGVQIGKGNTIGPYCVIGFPAEFKGREMEGKVAIGDNNTITGLVTIDSGTNMPTTIGSGCYIMKHAHIGHDAQIFNGATISCGAKIGGHARVYDHANIGLNACIHQGQVVRPGAMIGMGAIVTKKLEVEAFKTYAGNPAKLIGENSKHPLYEAYKASLISLSPEDTFPQKDDSESLTINMKDTL